MTRPKNFIETDTETFFETKYLRDRYRDFFSRSNVFETDTETFSRDQMFSRLILRLFLRPNVFETDTKTFFRPNFLRPIPKVSTSVLRMRVSGPGGRNLTQRCPFSLVLQGQCWQFLHLQQSRRELSQREEILSRDSA